MNNNGWNLFNPIPNFNYINMSYKIDAEVLDNPYVQVVWEDDSENFTQEKIKSVRHYFQKKYNTTNVNVITKSKVSQDVVHSVDISFNILDKNYLSDLIKTYLSSKSLDNTLEQIINLDNVVDGRLALKDTEAAPFKRWYIRNIEFSNFLSYGENQKIDFDKCDGISVIESNPPNFGGKCIRYDTEIEIDFDSNYIVNMLGFLPDELK